MSEYRQTIDWLFRREAALGMDFRLQRLEPVLERLDHPEESFEAIHVAGTNGKGSTVAMLHEVYTRAGYRAGMYTSPHLLSFRERIRVGRDLIAEPWVVEHSRAVRRAMDAADVALTFFEIATLMAFLEFRRRAVDVAVVEVGMGGRLDATSLVRPVASVITSIARDHARYLGASLAEIASEKAGIARPGVPLVSGPLPAEAEPVVETAARAAKAPRMRYGVDFGPFEGAAAGWSLAGSHQAMNVAVAAAVVHTLHARYPVPTEGLRAGIEAARWPARFEVLAERPRVVVDSAHNPAAVEALIETLESVDLPRPRVLVFGVMADKDWREMLAVALPAFDQAVFVPVAQKRALDPEALVELAAGIKPAARAPSAATGLAEARRIAGAGGSVVVAGSIFLAAELYTEAGGSGEPFGESR